MLDLTASALMNDMTVEDIREYIADHPTSTKKVVRVCDDCDKREDINAASGHEVCLSCSKKRFWANPENRKAQSETMDIRWAKEDSREIYLSKMNKHYNDPVYKEKQSVAKKEYWSDPANRTRHSIKLIASEAHRRASEAMVGGNDIIQHHFLYDESDKRANTVEMTRSQHTSMHCRMRGQNIEVPRVV